MRLISESTQAWAYLIDDERLQEDRTRLEYAQVRAINIKESIKNLPPHERMTKMAENK